MNVRLISFVACIVSASVQTLVLSQETGRNRSMVKPVEYVSSELNAPGAIDLKESSSPAAESLISGARIDSSPESSSGFSELPAQFLINAANSWQPAEKPTWTFNFGKAPWPTVLREFANLMDFSLTMNNEPNGEFTYFDNKTYTPLQAIDIFNDQLIPLGSILILRDASLIVVSTDEPIRDEYVRFISVDQIDLLDRNTVAGAAIPVSGMEVNIALGEISPMMSPLGSVKPFTHSGRILVVDTGTHLKRIRDLLMQRGFAQEDSVSQVYQLRHAKAVDVAEAVNDFISQQAEGAATSGPSGDTIFQRGQAHVTPEATTNSLLLRGTAEMMDLLCRLLAELDRSPREVLLQALIVEVQLGNTLETGVELGFQDSVLFDRSIVDSIQTINQTVTSPNGVQTTNQNILSQVSTPGLNFNGPLIGNNAINTTRIGAQSLSNFGLGRTNGDLGYGGLVLSAGSESVNLLVRALDAKFKLDILSRPQVRTVENVEAFIQVGQQVPVVDGVSVNSVGTANPIVRQDRAGIILRATPRISPDGRVQVVVETEKSAFNLTRGSGVPIFTDATTGRVIEAPVKDITTASTTVSVQSGQTIVLGGMINTTNNVVDRKVPVLGSIPLLGRLFRYDLDRCDKKELIVFLTPIVLHSQAQANQLLVDDVERSHVAGNVIEELDRWEGYRMNMLHQPLEGAVIEQIPTYGGELIEGLAPEQILPEPVPSEPSLSSNKEASNR